MFHWLTERRRRHLLESPFPDAWRGYLEANLAAYAKLAPDDQAHLRDLVQVFVAEKQWEGCGGLELTDEMRVTIAGSACMMIVHREHELFADVHSILVYPHAVMSRRADVAVYSSLVPIQAETGILGEAHRGGPLVLAWDATLRGARDARDGRNLVVHEMAHKIDFLDGAIDGTPPLPDGAARRAWRDAFQPAFLAHRERAERGEPSLVRDYAITNEAEYFACVSEVFFEKPRQLRDELPEVYAELARFYRLDLAS